MIPVILSGGSGSRLWPLSRQVCPKQFLALHTEKTLFQETVLRLKNLKLSEPIVVCNNDHRFTIANNLQDIDCKAQEIILEPVGRNTAPAIAAAAVAAMKIDKDAVLLVLPADHEIKNEVALGKAYQAAKELAEKGYLVTFGVKPTEPHTGYGYIQLGDELGEGSSEIASFVEKPNEDKAEEFLSDGGYLWNSGMFCFKASRYLEELGANQPEMLKFADMSVSKAKDDYDFLRLDQDSFEQCNNISIDYAVMEKTQKGCVVSIDAEWSDIGSWDAVWGVSNKGENDNVCHGDVIEHDTKSSFLYSADKLLVTIGVENLMVVNTADAILIADKAKAQNVKHVVDQLKAENRKEVRHHAKVDRPWGAFDLLHSSDASEVKHVCIKQGSGISLQTHQHRSEHWVVLSGTAKVRKGDEVLTLSAGESVYIPQNIEHSLENASNSDLEIIEVRIGESITEEDIVRIAS